MSFTMASRSPIRTERAAATTAALNSGLLVTSGFVALPLGRPPLFLVTPGVSFFTSSICLLLRVLEMRDRSPATPETEVLDREVFGRVFVGLVVTVHGDQRAGDRARSE